MGESSVNAPRTTRESVSRTPDPRESVRPDPWTDETKSPWSDEETVVPREKALEASCGTADAALRRVARELATQRARGLTSRDPDMVSSMLRAAGEPHLAPHVVVASGVAPLALSALFPAKPHARCGVVIEPLSEGREIVVGLAVDALADLSPLPRRARAGEWLTFRGTVHVPVLSAKLVVLGPRGAPHTVPTALDAKTGTVHARFALDSPGAFTVQLVGELESGPRPLLEARLFADMTPPTSIELETAPGEALERETAVPASDLLARMMNVVRVEEHLPSLVRDPHLDVLANAHAEAMRAKHTVAHDVGDGDLRARFEASTETARSIGENVAHAASIGRAHRAIYGSASHRMNLLRADYTHMGVGVATADDGSVYVCEVFAADD